MSKRIRIKGYITSKPFMGERVPQNVQNLFIRNFCNSKKYNYLLSGAEYAMKNSYHILEELIINLKQYDGIIAYSIFQLPVNSIVRIKLIKKIIKKKKFFLSAIENIKIQSMSDIEKMEILWKIKLTLPNCLNIENEKNKFNY
jgi:sporadic carbohydrate cluster protein (TIGR04323 family)